MKATSMRCYYWLVSGPTTDEQGHEYYGVHRNFTTDEYRSWDDSPASEVFKDWCCADWEMDEEWDTFFPTVDTARDFQARFRKFGFSSDLIAIYPCESAEDVAEVQALSGFLGLDVSSTEPNTVLGPHAVWREFGPYECPLDALWDIESKYARLRVNRYGLLSNYEDAALLRDVARALEKIDETHQTVEGACIMAIQQIAE